ncbi:MAG: hypothetical protein Q4C66_00540 [Lachnospiraceae bacterium]|nr:hypothetical protein [Lachnospiraceae bacterium]
MDIQLICDTIITAVNIGILILIGVCVYCLARLTRWKHQEEKKKHRRED